MANIRKDTEALKKLFESDPVFKAASEDEVMKRNRDAYVDCEICKVNMAPRNKGCWGFVADNSGKWVKRIPYGGNGEYTDRPCGDCGVRGGGYHHHGCDSETCPKCHGQMLGCECDWTQIADIPLKKRAA